MFNTIASNLKELKDDRNCANRFPEDFIFQLTREEV
jgi:hypothetical protein